MLLLHTTGVSKIGEIHRYTITYTPSVDRVLPLPSALHLRIKNTASLPLRAAYLHGPYTLYVSVRRQEFEPWSSTTPGTEGRKEELAQEDDRGPVLVDEGDIPVFEPQLKAGSSFYATLPIPSDLIEDALNIVRREGETMPDTSTHTRGAFEKGGQQSTLTTVDTKLQRKSVTWIVEVISQTIFSATAQVGFEVILGRDEKSLNYNTLPGPRPPTAGSIDSDRSNGDIYSRALKVKTQDTHDLWNTPPFPSWHREEDWRMQNGEYLDPEDQDEAKERRRRKKKRKTKKVHLVILTHGLHSNTGADMLFMKEAIDEEARKGDIAWRERRRREREESGKILTDSEAEEEEEEEDREQVIVRGFHDNVCRTERGIKYLGRRLARYVLHLVHPSTSPPPPSGPNKLSKRPTHHHPHLTPFAQLASLVDHDSDDDVPPYKITSISFIGHSLGGLVQTYAIAYIHAHSPNFFTDITPISFVALATPFLGLSNENPMYVKFALDFGLVGRTGQDLGLTWRAPSAFSAFTAKPAVAARPTDTSKPLLRILPTGPAHEVLKKFRNRTVYANVVNDGIVPLRTSCLLFLDWKGLGKVEKARRENNAVQSLVGWGWGQLINGGSTSPRGSVYSPTLTKSRTDSTTTSPVSPAFRDKGKVGKEQGGKSPLIPTSDDDDDDDNPITEAPLTSEPTTRESKAASESSSMEPPSSAKGSSAPNALTTLMTLFRPSASSKSKGSDSKSSKIYRRSQTNPHDDDSSSSSSKKRNKLKTTPSFPQPPDLDSVPNTPPRTTLLEAANHVLNPPLPSVEFLIDPSSRPRTIFHDRVYSSSDCPPPPSPTIDKDNIMKVEEKIARAYHADMAWRKVLVSLEPDAHNNMIVRRMFANAYGWPVVRHVVETHFGESWSARTADEIVGKEDRAATPEEEAPGDVGDVGDGQQTPVPEFQDQSLENDTYLDVEREIASIRNRARSPTTSSGAWSDRAFAITDDDDSDSDVEVRKEEEIGRFLGLQPRLQRPSLGLELTHKSTSSTSGISRVEVVVSPVTSGSGDLGDGPSAVWGETGSSGGLSFPDATRIGLGRWGSSNSIPSGARPTGASLEAVRCGTSGSDAVRLLERNISIAGPNRNSGSRAGSSKSADTERGTGNSRAGSHIEGSIQGDLSDLDGILSLTSEAGAVN
ncbi:uncharacterized protein H6S33_004503 [Morchella sextelata]|uniref:uncharacterized protein n=1 Tax=Morchella sextelata TaxID=1174677 RepID=UPI001D043CAA|nr:uncharacterized protein H6S33_004503 [Morchella sextelata]KAH0606046.1 hypothetical protein H6S33_004503 [Morchella sextelata]